MDYYWEGAGCPALSLGRYSISLEMMMSSTPTIKSTKAPIKVCRQSMELLVGFFFGSFISSASLHIF